MSEQTVTIVTCDRCSKTEERGVTRPPTREELRLNGAITAVTTIKGWQHVIMESIAMSRTDPRSWDLCSACIEDFHRFIDGVGLVALGD